VEKQHKRFWAAVREIVPARYDALVKRSMRGSYYIVGDLLAPLIGSRITMEDYTGTAARASRGVSLKACCYLSSLVFISLLLLQIFFAIPSAEGAEGFKVIKIAYIDRALINYDIIKNIVEKLNMTVDFIEPNKIHDYDLRKYDLIAIGPLAFDFMWERGLSEEQIMRIANAGKPLLLIGEGPSMIPYIILGKDYVKKHKLPAYPLTAHAYADKYILVPSDLEVLSYPYKISIAGYTKARAKTLIEIKVYETLIGRAAHIYIGEEISGMIIGKEVDRSYATIAIYKDEKIFYALWTYDQLHSLTPDGEKTIS